MSLNEPGASVERLHACDGIEFFRAWLAAPLRTGAQVPSGRELAQMMAATVNPVLPGIIVELGPGTGAVTAALLARGISPERVVLIEVDPRFCRLLQTRYPAAHVVQGDAYDAPRLLRQLGVGPVGAVVSGLPLLTQKPARRQRLLLECLRLGTPGVSFVQFTYCFRSPIPTGSGTVAASVSPMV